MDTVIYKRSNSCLGRMRWLAGIIITGILLSACQAEPARPPIATITSFAPATSTPPPAALSTPQPSATVQEALTDTPVVTITVPGETNPISAGNIVLPILMYHRVSDVEGGRYTIDVKTFREMMEKLKNDGYQTITISQLADAVRYGGSLPEKPVAITFDDGYLDIYENAFPILREMGFVATAYIITGTLGSNQSYGYLQENELKELIAAGWEIGSHGVTHTDLNKTKLGAGNEMKQSKEDLETKLGIKVRSFSYPFGIANQTLKDLASEMGYESGVGVDIINTHTTKRLYFLSRREVYRSMPLWQLEKLLQPSKDDILTVTLEAVTETPAPR